MAACELLLLWFMQITQTQPPRPLTLIQASAAINFRQSITGAEPLGSQHASAEINAYIAIRDDLLAEAEEVPTCAKLDSVAVANDFVESCLQSPRPAYKAQHLPPAEAIREHKRCEEVRDRIVKLRAHARAGTPAS